MVRCPREGTRSREPGGREPQAPTAAPVRDARPAFLPMMGFLSLAALWADSPRFAAPLRRTSRQSRRPRFAIALAVSRRLSKALRPGRGCGGGAGSGGLAPLGGVGRGGAPPRGPLGNAVRARARGGRGTGVGGSGGAVVRTAEPFPCVRHPLPCGWRACCAAPGRLRKAPGGHGVVSASSDLPCQLFYRYDLGSPLTKLGRAA